MTDDTRNGPRCPVCGWQGITTDTTTAEQADAALAYHRANDCPGNR